MGDDDTKFDFGEEEEDDGAVVAAKGKELERAWAETTQEVQKQMQLLASYGTAAGGMADAAMVPRTNALLQDHMAKLRTLIVRYEMIAQQYPS